MVRTGGLIAFHDIVPDHRAREQRPGIGECWAGGVHRLWQEVKGHSEHVEFVCDPGQNGFGIGVLVNAGRSPVC